MAPDKAEEEKVKENALFAPLGMGENPARVPKATNPARASLTTSKVRQAWREERRLTTDKRIANGPPEMW